MKDVSAGGAGICSVFGIGGILPFVGELSVGGSTGVGTPLPITSPAELSNTLPQLEQPLSIGPRSARPQFVVGIELPQVVQLGSAVGIGVPQDAQLGSVGTTDDPQQPGWPPMFPYGERFMFVGSGTYGVGTDALQSGRA